MASDNDLPDNEASNGASVPSPGAGVKVELDIDDAPFLKEQEEPPAPAKKPEKFPDPDALPPPKPKESKAKGLLAKLEALLANKKRLAIIGGALAFLLITPLILMLFLPGGKPPPPPEPERIVQSATPPRDDAPPGPKFLYKADDFFVPLRGTEGELRFLRCRFSIPTENPQLYAELMAKNIAVRDSIYYYLSHKSLSFLSDQAEREVLKRDLISVVNEHVSAEKIAELFIEDYLVSGK